MLVKENVLNHIFDDVLGWNNQLWNYFDTPVRSVLDAAVGPAIRTSKSEDKLRYHVDLPGIPREQIGVSLQGQILSISAVRKEGEYSEKFHSSITIPKHVDPETLEATMENGVLTFSMKENSRDVSPPVKQIEIKTGTGNETKALAEESKTE